VIFCVMYYLCIVFFVLALPQGRNPFAIKISNNNNNKFYVVVQVPNHKISYVTEQVSITVTIYISRTCSFGIRGDVIRHMYTL
jgi:uncharacterized protein (UPF0333 family)